MLSLEQLNAIRLYNKNKPFKILESDKNVGVCIISNELFDKLATEHLDNQFIYNSSEDFDIKDKLSDFKSLIIDFKGEKLISKRLHNHLIRVEEDVGKFRFLPKIHKTKFSIRPIINCKNSFTKKISLLIDCILKPFVKVMSSFIQDSKNLIQKTQNLEVNEDKKLYSCDFESLYTNIDHNLAIELLREYFFSL
jgi:hypothetical protein